MYVKKIFKAEIGKATNIVKLYIQGVFPYFLLGKPQVSKCENRLLHKSSFVNYFWI